MSLKICPQEWGAVHFLSGGGKWMDSTVKQEFCKNIKFTTIEEACMLCKTIPARGYKLYPLGGRGFKKEKEKQTEYYPVASLGSRFKNGPWI